MTLSATLDVTVSDDAVEFAFAVTNDGDDPVELSFSDSQKADFVVLEGDAERWRWSQGMMFTQMLESETLDPGATRTYTAAWDDPAPGDYDAVATLEARNYDLEARSSFSV